ncbi:MAG TPA: hypothetical protein VM305_09390 [Candidatus Limnocylindrales bacterium]|nr:hypothetical protein [Candidatus Limnocylindrales bacterium]
MADQVAAARQEVANARLAAESELNEMGTAVRSAVDIPSKIKRDPLRYGAIGAGVAFLGVNGPKRVIRAVEKRVFPRPKVDRLTPKEVQQTIDRLPEENREAVHNRLEREFAAFLRKEHPRAEPSARHSLWNTYDLAFGILGGAALRELVKRFIDAPADRNAAPTRKGPPADEQGLGL